jgi:hypothetical protein
MAGLLLSVAGFCALLPSAQAGSSTFTDHDGDLMLVFRKTGFDGSFDVGASVYEVDIGQASIYAAAPGTSIPVTAYSASGQLANLFDSLDDFSWSVSGCVPNYGGPQAPASTLWVTAPRGNPSIPSAAWQQEGSYTQGGAAAYIESILAGAATFAGTANSSTYNTSTALAIPYGSGDNANGYLGAVGNFDGNFQGSVENTTLPTFSTDGLPSRSDFYELEPGSGAGMNLGYFELATNGSLTFFAPSQALPAPVLSISAVNSSAVSISFPTAANGTYTLFYTSASGLAAPVSSWQSVSTNIIGDGTVKAFQQPISGAGTFYTVRVH